MQSAAWTLLILLVGLANLPPSSALAEDGPYQELRVFLHAQDSLRDLLRETDVELMGRGDGEARILSRPAITRRLLDRGWHLEVIHPDLESTYASRLGEKRESGAWHTYEATVAELNFLHEDYPGLASVPAVIGQTGEGRDLWAIKVSDNPEVDEDEPEVLFDGVHHAREIMAVEMNLYFARYLCENYGSDPVVTYLVDNREVWFVPIVNADGFAYNETTNPGGGGLWRKNRSYDAATGCYGVDPNRNYPFEWTGPGSSSDPCSEVYRGPSPASEPEIQALMSFVNSHKFVTHDSFHSVAGMVLMPWGYTVDHTPDDAVFRVVANERARENGYIVGQPPEVLYEVNGGCIDWMYGEQASKPKILSFSTEIGGSGFWPYLSEKDGLIAENLHSVLYLTQVAGVWTSTSGLTVSGGDGNGRIDPGEAVDLLTTIRNEAAFAPMTGATVRLRCDDPYIRLLDASSLIVSLGPQESSTNSADPFRVEAESGSPVGSEVTFTVLVDGAGGLHQEAPFILTIGEVVQLASYDFEEPEDAWIQDASHSASSGAFVRIDPVGTGFQPEDDTTPAPGVSAWVTGQNPQGMDGVDDVDRGVAATRSPDFDLSTFARVRLTMNYFFGQQTTGDDPTGDCFLIEASQNGGESWVNLVRIGDVATGPEWRSLSVRLEDFISLTSQVRLRVRVSDGLLSTDIIEAGIDDFTLSDGGLENLPPGVPSPISPPDGATDLPGDLTLVVGNATDPESDLLTYGFRIYADADLTQIARSVDGVGEGAGSTSWTVTPPLDPGTYSWRAYGADADRRGLFTEPCVFTVVDPAGAANGLYVGDPYLLARPNPAGLQGTTIRYFVPATSTSRLAVYDPEGKLVRSLQTAPSASGWHEVVWDGNDDAGRRAASGSYWVRLWVPGETRTVRVVRID